MTPASGVLYYQVTARGVYLMTDRDRGCGICGRATSWGVWRAQGHGSEWTCWVCVELPVPQPRDGDTPLGVSAAGPAANLGGATALDSRHQQTTREEPNS